MIDRIALLGAVILAAAATSASAQQTQTYAYDVHGRLAGVIRTTSSTSQTTTYVLDKVDNRTSRIVSAPNSAQAVLPSEPSHFSNEVTNVRCRYDSNNTKNCHYVRIEQQTNNEKL